MDLSTLKTHIKMKTLDPVYIFTGPEVGVMDIYINQMAKVRDATVVMLDGIEDLARKMHKGSMLKNSQIYILRDSKEFIQDSDLALKITQKNTLNNAILLLIYTNIDKRSKVYKTFQDSIVEFDGEINEVIVKGEKYYKPTVDAVPVVRCRECKWMTAIDTAWHPCTEMFTDDDWFCADGERKDGDGDG